jgi:hypothetical protein
VPLGLGSGRTFRLGALPDGDALGELAKLPVNTSLQAYYNAVTPSLGPDWQLRFQVQFLFPQSGSQRGFSVRERAGRPGGRTAS